MLGGNDRCAGPVSLRGKSWVGWALPTSDWFASQEIDERLSPHKITENLWKVYSVEPSIMVGSAHATIRNLSLDVEQKE
jgi:hypothetical protein